MNPVRDHNVMKNKERVINELINNTNDRYGLHGNVTISYL